MTDCQGKQEHRKIVTDNHVERTESFHRVTETRPTKDLMDETICIPALPEHLSFDLLRNEENQF